MSKITYLLLTFCGILYVGSTALQISLQDFLGHQLFLLPSFLPWLGVAFATSLLWLGALLSFHIIANHPAAKIAITIHLIATIFRCYTIYAVFSAGSQMNLYFPSYFLVLTTWGLYGICLIYTSEKNRVWLKTAGFYIIGITAVLIVTLIMYLYATDAAYKAAVENFHNKLSWFSELATVPLLVHWVIGWKQTEVSVSRSTLSRMIKLAVFLAGMASAIAGLVVHDRLLHEKPVAKSPEPPATSKDVAHAERFEARTYVDKKGNRLQYRLMKPMHYDTAKKYPVVLCLHGGAGWGTDNIKQVFGSLPAVLLSNYLVREKHPAFLVVPQVSAGYSWGGLPNLETADTIVAELLQNLEKEFKIDRKRRYIAGNSLGGYGTWYFIGKYPKLFAAAIPISGDGDPGLAKQMSQVPIWAFHGAKDINVPVSGSRRMISALRQAGANPRYSEYPDAGHGIWIQVMNTPDLVEWLFKQERKIEYSQINLLSNRLQVQDN
ncbi:carboxylesterase family protein [Dyadobacter crusticola]|uniref:carboxylesterase family protein n=1 Tax=Dyadobacter crusticola TaxID=292407 RepID=UPI00068E99ED|nr:prolyl oligopeptidase family serine peptidase [Dyadobacter crusticola]